jgi:lipopolysaccharide assembly protein B
MLGLMIGALVPLAAASGWWAGQVRRRRESSHRLATLSRHYFVGLNYLLDEQPDKAVDVFLKLAEVDGETVETHLALGSLFRRRGEVDRAIRVHQNLVARTQLSPAQRELALVALGRDYMSAGVLDRAERVFCEVVNIGEEYVATSLAYLLDIYQQEKAWRQAMKTAQQLQALTQENMQAVIAHHYCELATRALAAQNRVQAEDYLQAAVQADPAAVRASVLKAQIAEQQGDYPQAIQHYQAITLQDPDFISYAVLLLSACYDKTGNHAEFIAYLQVTLEAYPRVVIVLELAKHLAKEQGPEQAADFVTAQLRSNPSLKGLSFLIAWHLDAVDGKIRDKLEVLRDVTSRLLENLPVYRCKHCGFSGKTLHWQCPGCKKWSTVKPIHGLQGD